MQVGRILWLSPGCDYVWHAKADAAAATNVIDCINNAEIYFYTDASKSNSTCGGIVSWPNPEQAGNKNYISGCVNNGVITVEGTGKLRAGGISAGLVLSGIPSIMERLL